VLIQGARQKTGRTRQECARALGTTVPTIIAYEEGRKDVSLPELELLAYFLDVPLSQFWGGAGDVLEAPEAPPPPQLLALRQRIIALLLREAQSKSSKSQQDLATILGCSPRTISQYMQGQRAIPVVHLELLSEHLGLPLSYFLDEGIGIVGERELNERLFEQFKALPEDVRQFVVEPANEMYIRVGMRLSEKPASELRQIAEGILEITY
jgi:transcriptional regulator with XRE-family HTH domain